MSAENKNVHMYVKGALLHNNIIACYSAGAGVWQDTAGCALVQWSVLESYLRILTCHVSNVSFQIAYNAIMPKPSSIEMTHAFRHSQHCILIYTVPILTWALFKGVVVAVNLSELFLRQ